MGWCYSLKVVDEDDVFSGGFGYGSDYRLSKFVLLHCVHSLELVKSHEFRGKALHEFAEWSRRLNEDCDVFVGGKLSIWNADSMR